MNVKGNFVTKRNWYASNGFQKCHFCSISMDSFFYLTSTNIRPHDGISQPEYACNSCFNWIPNKVRLLFWIREISKFKGLSMLSGYSLNNNSKFPFHIWLQSITVRKNEIEVIRNNWYKLYSNILTFTLESCWTHLSLISQISYC